MNSHRILVLSRVRPSRAWGIANRISREIPGAEICGIVQHSIHKLSSDQQRIAAGRLDDKPPATGFIGRVRIWCRSGLVTLLNFVLWCIHGCPRFVHNFTGMSIKKFADECRNAGWPVLVGGYADDLGLVSFVSQQRPELGIALGEHQLDPQLMEVPARGWISVYHRAFSDRACEEEAVEIRVEYMRNAAAPFTIVSVSLPRQPYDTPAALALKADLIADDLLRQTINRLLSEDAVLTSEAVTAWANKILSPYLEQPNPDRSAVQEDGTGARRHRSAWKLSMETLLFAPLLAGRNWYRRLIGKAPVTILTHHLVSDRPHPMGISTAAFWKQARFLQKHYGIVSLSQGLASLHSSHLKIPTVVLTFDDGYADNFVSLRAVAEELGLPVVLFIATEPVGTQREFQHDLSAGIKGAMPLTWDQIRYWSTQGAEFGSHTRTHFDCGSNDRPRLEEEIVGGKHDLEAHLGVPVDSFAFPFGWQQNVSAASMEIAGCSHRYFFSSVRAEDLPAETASGHVLRKGFYSDPWELELDIQGVFEMLENGKRKIRAMLQPSTVRNRELRVAAHKTHEGGSLLLDEGSAEAIPASFDISGS